MAAEEMRRTVEDLAQALYEEKDPSGLPWGKRGHAVRNPWFRLANQIESQRTANAELWGEEKDLQQMPVLAKLKRMKT
jgi:hypothetical protein